MAQLCISTNLKCIFNCSHSHLISYDYLHQHNQSEVLDPYPQLNGGQQIGAREACPFQPLHLCIRRKKKISLTLYIF